MSVVGQQANIWQEKLVATYDSCAQVMASDVCRGTAGKSLWFLLQLLLSCNPN